MISIDEQYVAAVAPNADAVKNGRALVLKNKFSELHVARDQTLIFGKCQGSGASPYDCSSDFADPSLPVHRCSCPSRQFPCKHCVGLMLAFVANPSKFTIAEPPGDLQAKRQKAEARAEKKKSEVAKPKQVNTSALKKKIQAQLDGLDLLERLTHNLMNIGIGNMNAKWVREIDVQAKQLGDSYLPGAQMALRAYTSLFFERDGRFDDSMTPSARERVYSEALDKLATLNALIKMGREYLSKRRNDPELKPDTETNIAAWLGHAWQLAELREAGLMLSNVELIQLAFNSHDDVARQEFIDTGIWIDLERGTIFTTKNYRPYKAAKFMKSDDSFFQVAQIPNLYVYPGEPNQRVRWEDMTTRPIVAKDFTAMLNHAHSDFAEVTKQIKGHLKGPLSEKQPVCLLRFHRIGQVGDRLVAEDQAGNRLTMIDHGIPEEPMSLHLIPLVPATALRNQALLARFRHDLDSQRLEIKPLTIVTSNDCIRLTL